MSSESYQGLARIEVFQMTGDDVLIRPITSTYQDLDIEIIKDLITSPDLIYGEGASLVKNWTMNDSGPRGKFIIDSFFEDRCYVNHHDYIKVKFPDGPVSISAVIFVYCNQVSQVGYNVLLNGRRYPFNFRMLAGGGEIQQDGTSKIVYKQFIEDKQYAIHYFPDTKVQEFVNPYDIAELPDRNKKDIYQAVICSAEMPSNPFMIHNANELLFKMSGDVEASPYDLSRVFIFGANSVTCRPPSANFSPIVEPHNTNLLLSPPGILPPGIGGPNSCLDIISTQDETNAMTYVYGPYTTLPEHYLYLANNHSGDLFTKATIDAFYDGDDNAVSYQVNDLNILFDDTPVTFFIELSKCDIYQFNFEHSGSALSPTSELTLRVQFNSSSGDEIVFDIGPASHESLQTKHKRSRGVVSKWFPGFPWNNNRKTCIIKDCVLIELTVTGVASDAEQQAIWHSFLIRTLNPSHICSVDEDETIPPVSNKPNQNTQSVIIADTGAGDPTCNEAKQLYTHPHVVTPAWNVNEYPYYDPRHEEYNILDSSFSQYFLSSNPGASDITRITDGYFHVDDPFIGDSTINFSSPVDIYHIRVFFKGGNITTTNALSIGIVDSYGVASPIRPVQTDYLLVQSSNTTSTSINLRTNPWDFPFSVALFGNVSKLIILNPNEIIGFFIWGAYLKLQA